MCSWMAVISDCMRRTLVTRGETHVLTGSTWTGRHGGEDQDIRRMSRALPT